MWYTTTMERHPLEPALKEARAAVRHAQDTRNLHARRSKKGTPQREEDLKQARERIRLAMVPLKTFLGRAPFVRLTQEENELWQRATAASKALQRERMKVWKMQN